MSVVPFCSVKTTTAVLLDIQRLSNELALENKRYAALLSEAAALTDYWSDLTAQPNWTNEHKAFRKFDKRLKLFREDTRLFQEALEFKNAEASTPELPDFEPLRLAS